MSTNKEASTGAHPDPAKHWRWRRYGMLVGIYWSIIQTLMWAGLAFYSWKYGAADTPNLISSLSVVIAWSYGVCMVLIIGYYSNTAVDEFAKRIPK